MAHFFGADPVAFYDTAINTDIPDDAVEITADEHAALLAAQARGKRIAAGKDGRPILLDPPAPTRDELESFERIWRDARLRETDPLVARHRDEIEAGDVPTLDAEKYSALQTYRRALRDWPEAGEFPLAEHRPKAPEWLADELAF
ncbi:phage tail assembly chaperone [Pseudomonas aeruginosa]|uniref:phage tail assembly chaperone n=1 Tax=Pseudomonas aeruginosa TaxID=287 RepID=UPI00071BBC41|nr:phage tail assembly chaperone [Pseudomonas aeruginosa]KSL06275.1 phage tail protein [Pseudomonas aeruginosa]KSL63662.1 phage tail protein [Pseudomonas aeruginosa]